MRNLSLFRSSCACIPQSSELTITACAVDLDEKVLYVVAEGPSVIEVWKCADEGVVDEVRQVVLGHSSNSHRAPPRMILNG